MGRVIALIFLAFALAPLHATPKQPRAPAKKASAAASGGRTSVAKRSSVRTPVSRSVHSVSARSGRARSGRVVRVVHTAPAPTYQLHPDPDRYQVIQKALADRGYFKGEPTGEWGDDSGEAMRRFQADQKIDNDGKIDSLSLIALGLGPKHDGSSAAIPRVAPTPVPLDSSLASPSSPLDPSAHGASGGQPH